MKRILLVTLCSWLCALPVLAQTQKEDAESYKVKEEIKQVLKELQGIFERKDQAAFERLLAPGFLIVNPLNEVRTRASTIGGALNEMPPEMKVTRRLENIEIATDKNTATAIYQETLEMELNQQRINSPQRVSAVFIRSGKTWQMLSMHRTDLPLKRTPKALDATALDEFVGTYQGADNAIAKVTRDGDKLISQREGGAKFTLVHHENGMFYAPAGGSREMAFTFIRDEQGKVTHQVIINPLPASTVFVRKKIK